MLVKTSLLTSVMLLCYLVFFGQPAFPYEHEWKLADSLMNKKNLPKSALEEVNKIYIAAKKDKQEAQWVRAIIYKNHLQEIDERDINQSLRDLEEEISMAPPRVVSLLKSVEAEELFQYLQGHRYQLGNRTTILADTSNDISTWTTSRFDDRISKLYVSSIANADLLKKTPLENFNPVLTAGNARDLRPTLYDLLTWRALDYFRLDYDVSSGNDLLKRNAYLFSEALFFMHVAFDSKDSLSYGLITLKLYQELLRFHAKDIPLNAWIDADISRIQFVYQYSNLLDKDSLYLNALGRITRQYPSLSASTQSWYLQAKWWADQASTFEPLTDTTHRYDYLKAIALCDQAVKYPDSSEGKSNAVDLLKEIKRKHFNLTTEAVNIPEHPIRVLVVYKNINHLFGRIVKMDKETGKLLAKTDPAAMYWQRLANMPVFKTFQQSIPDTKDCQQHAVEIKVDRLSAGQYVLLTSSDTAFNEKSMMSAVAFYCSSISYVRNRFDYFVLDRDSGHPLKGVKIKTFIRKNNENEYPVLPSDSYLSDINGHFKLAFNERREDVNSIRLEFSTVRDFFTSDQYDYYYRHGKTNDDDDVKAGDRQEYEDDHLKDNLYTDRSIYRPGQIVFFKGILVTRDFKTRKYKPVTGEKATIFLKDVNDQTIDSVFLTSNDFGSIHGSFRLPQNLLNGKFKLYDGNTLEDKEFSVEEYKRPTFAVELDAVKNAYSIGDTIRVNGSAIANAGNSVGDAKLSWNVVRESRIPYPWIFRNYPSRSSRQIAHGEAKTDAEGKFTIIFPALPDPSLKKEAGAVYTYQIETTISDINGETRSATIAVSASNHSFEIISSLDLQTRTCPDSLQQIPVTTKNAAGIFVPEKLSISLSPLENPSRLIRKRYWQEPDEFVMSEPEYISSFPNDEYRNELDMKSWHRRSAILEKSDSTHLNGFVSLDKNLLKSLKPGWYVLEFKATDKGQLISDKRYIELVKDSGKSGLYSYDIIPEEDVLTEPGSPIKISTGSDAANLFVIRSKEKLADSLTDFSFYSLNQETKQFNIEITESDRGGFALNDVFVKNNRWYTSEHNIRVPWTNKELQISYLSWNDKTLPGSKQQWKIKISGNKKDKAAAEILTSVYDASLDQVAPQSWSIPDLYPLFSRQNEWSRGLDNFNFGKTSSLYATYYESSVPGKYHQQYDQLLVFPSGNRIYNLLAGRMNSVVVNYEGENKSDMVVAGYGVLKSNNQINRPEVPEPEKDESASGGDNIQTRKNFNETAFFQPDLKTDAQGNVELNFTMPDALTKWKWMVLANTKDLSFSYSERFAVTQKELMVQANIPRFFREGDTMLLPVKIANLSSQSKSGIVRFEWLDPTNNQSEDTDLGNNKAIQTFTVNASQSNVVFFPAVIPAHFDRPLLYRVIASTSDKSGIELSDGEKNVVPVLSNRMLVTESLPLNMGESKEKQFVFGKLLESGSSNSLQNQSLVVEYTTNPVWYAVNSLPYLMEFPYECAEQTFNRFYANTLGAHLVHSSPALQAIFEKWKNADTTVLISNLQKNEELKSILLRETPWVLQAQTESQQRKNLALLFDMIRMGMALKSACDKLQQMQSEDGGFAWFKGGSGDRYITQYIVSGIGRLRKLNAVPSDLQDQLIKMAKTAISFLDKSIYSDYEKGKSSKEQHIDPIQIQYLYMRSFFPEIEIPANILVALNYYRKLSVEGWQKEPVFMQGMISLILNRTGDGKTAKDILASLIENATVSADLGMYWKSVNNGYYWQEAPVETQALLIETFRELHADQSSIDKMKFWLLQQKRTNHWPTTKATADACYALLLDGSDWISHQQNVDIRLGDYKINSTEEKTEAGTGYFRKQITGEQVVPAMGNIDVVLQQSDITFNRQLSTVNPQQPMEIPSWGAVYWQYFENIDKVTSAQNQLSVTKNLFIEKNTDRGPVLKEVSENNILRPGDKLKMRIIIKTDRDLEYVHLKDMRAACLEPGNTLSGYQWQNGLGYYQTTQDASTSFFFDRLPRGSFVFEYPVYVTTAGNYSNGISILECMYAPEFAAHSEGIRLHVESK